jgi:hypothetical protein
MHIVVTPEDIAVGLKGDCYRCPVALALERVTGDTDANIFQQGYTLWIEAWSRCIPAPYPVLRFIRDFDDEVQVQSFAFDLPEQSDPEWKERCYGCEEFVEPSELDDEGFCQECGPKS